MMDPAASAPMRRARLTPVSVVFSMELPPTPMPPPTRPLAVSESPRVAADSAPSETLRPNSSSRVEDKTPAGDLAQYLPRSAGEAGALGPSSPAGPSGAEPGASTEGTAAWTNPSQAGSTSATEGGFVEIDAGPSASTRLLGRADRAATVKPSWISDASPGGVVSKDSGAKTPGHNDSWLTGDGSPLSAAAQAASADPIVPNGWVVDPEGGTIELAAADVSTSGRSDAALSSAAGQGLSAGVKDLRMDSSVGMFRVLELATTATPRFAPPGPAMDETSQSGLLFAPANGATVDSVAREESVVRRKESRTNIAQYGDIIPALAVVSMLVAADGIHLEERNSRRDRGTSAARWG